MPGPRTPTQHNHLTRRLLICKLVPARQLSGKRQRFANRPSRSGTSGHGHQIAARAEEETPVRVGRTGSHAEPLRTSDQLQIRFTRLFRQYGLTPSQYNILRILRGDGRPLPILEIANRTVTVVPGITGLIDRLEQAQFVRRRVAIRIAASCM